MTFLTLSGVQKQFGTTYAVHDFNLSAEKGEFVSFLGPSGCGKTTTLRMIAGFEQPTGGTITVGGTDITHRPPNQRNIGMVFQSYALFPNMTVADNIGFGMKVRKRPTDQIRKRVEELLGLINLPDKGGRFPYQLSGGQQQRVAVARAVAGEPAILLADEPTGNLDSQNGEAVMELLRELHRGGATICMVTHDPRYARWADREVKLFDGKVVEEEEAGERVSVHH